MMAAKTANVTARIQPDIKEHAEAILEIPEKFSTRDTLSKEDIDTIMQTGLTQAKRDESLSVEEAFQELKMER